MPVEEPSTASKTDIARTLKLKVTFAGRSKEVALADVLLIKGQETTLLAGQDFFAGSQGSMQVNVQSIKSIADTKGIDWIEILIQVVVAGVGVSIAAGLYGRR